MMRNQVRRSVLLRVLLGVLALLVYAAPSSPIAGVRRRTAVVAYSAGASHASAQAQQQAAAQQQQAAAAQQQQAAQQQTAAAQKEAATETAAAQSAAAAAQASAASAAAASQAAAHPATPQKTPQEKLADLQAMFKQGLISQSEYEAAKAKILKEME